MSDRPDVNLLRPIVYGLLACAGVTGLIFGSGAGTVDPAIASAMATSAQRMADSWAVSPVSWQRAATVHHGDSVSGHLLHLTRLTSSAADGPIAGDESYWLSNHNGTASTPGPIAVGAHISMTAPGGTAVSHDYEVIEITALALNSGTPPPTASTDPAVPKQLAGLTLVVAREVGSGQTGVAPKLIRFLIEAETQAPAAAAPRSANAL